MARVYRIRPGDCVHLDGWAWVVDAVAGNEVTGHRFKPGRPDRHPHRWVASADDWCVMVAAWEASRAGDPPAHEHGGEGG